jgi:4'-phosphopantetheinyl transferase
LRSYRGRFLQEELHQAQSFRSPEHGQNYKACRGILRTLLALYLPARPAKFCFMTTVNGKPALTGDARCELRFNVSHSGQFALFAFCQQREVGVDLEKVRSGVEELAVTHEMFAPSDISRLESLTGQARTEAFFEAWTRLEALAKATGGGLSGVKPARPGQSWFLCSLNPWPGYKAALAVEGQSLQLTGWDFDWSS